jgi:hypothetical protein
MRLPLSKPKFFLIFCFFLRKITIFAAQIAKFAAQYSKYDLPFHNVQHRKKQCSGQRF